MIQIQWIIVIPFYALISCQKETVLITRTYSVHLEKYTGYYDAAVLFFKIPEDVDFVSFQFQVKQISLSLFKCHQEDITIYLKYGSPPVINPDGSKFPDGFLKSGRPKLYWLEFKSDNSKQYINITSPRSGSYYTAAFISYTDPKHEGITQQGLIPECPVFLYARVHIKQKSAPTMIMANRDLQVLLVENTTGLYKFYVPEVADSAILNIKDLDFCENCTELQIKIQPFTIPAPNNTLHDIQLKKEDYNGKPFLFPFVTIENCWYYLTFMYKKDTDNNTHTDNSGQFLFKIYYLSSLVVTSSNQTQISKMEVKTEVLQKSGLLPMFNYGTTNNSIPFKLSLMRYPQNELNYKSISSVHKLIRDQYSDSFVLAFDLNSATDGVKINVLDITDTDVNVLKFYINEGLDIGGTLQVSLAFKPKIKTVSKMRIFENEPESHTIIACIRNGAKAIPMWPNNCTYNEENIETPIIIKKTVDNSTLYIPYPEPGDWYLTFKLFCGTCIPCKCSDNCKKQYRHCFDKCEVNCENSTSCDSCTEICKQFIINKTECTNCDCDGPCQRSKHSCSSTVAFDIACYPCVSGACGSHGQCIYQVSDGLAYSVCLCTNNYRGWDCTDDSQANSYAMIMLELLFLVLSNLLFLPAAYEGYRRGYCVEAIVYFSTCFFSTFYHACDAGENVISFCLVRLSALQFADFFCGLLSIWVTIIAIAYVPSPWTPIFHITGAILLSFFTTINKQALWVFALPFLTGMVILIVSWYMQYKKLGRRFPATRYVYIIFPIGLVTVTIGLLLFALLQTQQNYKYLHSMWHILMAFAIMILLPTKKSFLPPANEVDSVE